MSLFLIRSSGIALARRGLGARAMRLADTAAGLGMLGFGTALVYSTTRDR